ncbi:hypothetical protein GCM10007874_15160 [Labrys miyagiensis]|uniref:Uncharacterized protein n=1 Tax=Labrys miyagiensis TaxID=346912 RepID=A0ABQ6CFC9_9HYPH|nr:hypothetical protein GCM10007874_15160 [Labrys miyagiensis]
MGMALDALGSGDDVVIGGEGKVGHGGAFVVKGGGGDRCWHNRLGEMTGFKMRRSVCAPSPRSYGERIEVRGCAGL